MVAVVALYLLLSESYETINFTLTSTITRCIQKMLKTTNTGTKFTYTISKPLVNNYFIHCVSFFGCV